MITAGFHRAGLRAYTGFKTSPYTEGALFYGEKLVDLKAQDAIATQTVLVEELKVVECAPGGA